MPAPPFPVCQHCRRADADFSCWGFVVSFWKSDPSSGPWIAIVIDVVAVTAIVVGVNFLRRHGERLKAEAEFALPGALASRSGPHPTGSLWGLA